MKTGISRQGQTISDLGYLRQRLTDVIGTPKGSLVNAREFGSTFYQLIDRNIDSAFYMDGYIALSEAINNPVNGLDDFQLETMKIEDFTGHGCAFSFSGQLLNNGEPITINNIVVNYGRN